MTENREGELSRKTIQDIMKDLRAKSVYAPRYMGFVAEKGYEFREGEAVMLTDKGTVIPLRDKP